MPNSYEPYLTKCANAPNSKGGNRLDGDPQAQRMNIFSRRRAKVAETGVRSALKLSRYRFTDTA
jgi:hypothetical protein